MSKSDRRELHSRLLVQNRASLELGPFDDPSSPGGWWIATEVSVAYESHECHSHDLAGWRKERLPGMPSRVMDLSPDWLGEIVSPGHERKDTLQWPLLLRRHQVPDHWLIWPEDHTLIAQALEDDHDKVIATLQDEARARIPPFEAIELNLAHMLGVDSGARRGSMHGSIPAPTPLIPLWRPGWPCDCQRS